MTAGTVGTAPYAVINAVKPALPANPTCEQLKQHYNINVGTYNQHKKVPKTGDLEEHQSHHILQNEANVDLISKGQALCVLIQDSHSNTVHRETTDRQNQRRDDKTSATNFGELKKLSREDLEESFKKGGMPDDHAKKLAECLVDEAEEQTKEKGKKEPDEITDETGVRRVGACLPGDALVWLNETSRVPALAVRRRARITGEGRTMPVVRVDTCMMDFVQIRFDGAEVRLTSEHRVRTASGRLLRADRILPGEVLATHYGPRIVTGVLHDAESQLAFSVGMGEPFECRIGSIGLWVELAYRGVPVDRIEVLDRGVGGLSCTTAVAD